MLIISKIDCECGMKCIAVIADAIAVLFATPCQAVPRMYASHTFYGLHTCSHSDIQTKQIKNWKREMEIIKGKMREVKERAMV